ncbi:MAG: transglycosylase SLT domain-containing protein [Cyanobacteria bacterium P01_H01_bin.15]
MNNQSSPPRWIFWLVFLGLAIGGATLLTPRVSLWFEEWATSFGEFVPERTGPSPVLPLVNVPAAERYEQLLEIANNHSDRYAVGQARYLLAIDASAEDNPEQALIWLDNLERKLPVLAPYIWLKRGQAQGLLGETNEAITSWQTIADQYPGTPYAGEALYRLGQASESSEYWDQAIVEFPTHPLTHQLVRERLLVDLDNVDLLKFLATYDSGTWETRAIRDRLVAEFSNKLSPEDWAVIGAGYWDSWEYGKAAEAYQNAPKTAESLYRQARGYHIDKQLPRARELYQQLIDEFPGASDTGLGLRRYASISEPELALTLFDLAIADFPEQAAAALEEKGELLQQRNRFQAKQTFEKLLADYSDSEPAAVYRWQRAQAYAEQGNFSKAWEWARYVATANPDSPLAPKAIFWVGKWASRLNQTEAATVAFNKILSNYPESYYAWRAATMLGWREVGNFATVGRLQPDIVTPEQTVIPPAGSDVFRELYQLGQYPDAWLLFEAEIALKPELTVAEEFTDGLRLLQRQRYLQGINQIWNLNSRESQEDQAAWQKLRQSIFYWQGLFPLPYQSAVEQWSRQYSLNPLLVAALMRQESRFEKNIESSAGAVGLMQILPTTAAWVASQVPITDYSLRNPEDNMVLGTWYLDYTHREYQNNSMLAIASYNAGPGNVASWLERYSLHDLDEFVEDIPFPETQNYVETVFGNYWNYLRIYNPQIAKRLQEHAAELSSQTPE